ncbi:MAG TPA: hypothetical protein VMI75_05330 [Polyangiaceae bacterium]|nr:hypothetical protein [Polyangiaceae bacterium]
MNGSQNESHALNCRCGNCSVLAGNCSVLAQRYAAEGEAEVLAPVGSGTPPSGQNAAHVLAAVPPYDCGAEHHVFKLHPEADGLKCAGCGIFISGETFTALGFTRHAAFPHAEPDITAELRIRAMVLADACGDMRKERDDAFARIGELELELRRTKRR